VLAASSLSRILHAIGPKTASRFEPAVRAIAFHNTRFPAVDAGVDPVAALLILCDTVQEWGRSSLGFDKSPAVLLSRMMEASKVPEEDQFGPVQRYGVNVGPYPRSLKPGCQPDSYRWVKSNQLLIELDYGRQSLKDCAAKFTWADMTYNLQRVDFSPWDAKIEVQVSVPIPTAEDDSNIQVHLSKIKTQLEYFGEFVDDQQVRFIENWFRTAYENDPNNAVRSWIGIRNESDATWTELKRGELTPDNYRRAREVVTFNLQELGRLYLAETPLMGGHVGHFLGAIKAWSVYSREQEDAPPAPRPPI
jgi:hypothetical protein